MRKSAPKQNRTKTIFQITIQTQGSIKILQILKLYVTLKRHKD